MVRAGHPHRTWAPALMAPVEMQVLLAQLSLRLLGSSDEFDVRPHPRRR